MRVNARIWATALASVTFASACSPGAAESSPVAAQPAQATASTVHPESGLEVVPLTVSGDGRAHRFSVEVAGTSGEQARGLMFRSSMGQNEGMIFPLRPARPASFWMKNTVIPLDIIFVGTDGRILNIAANAVPYSEEPRRSNGVAAAVLELNGGRAEELGIKPGDTVSW